MYSVLTHSTSKPDQNCVLSLFCLSKHTPIIVSSDEALLEKYDHEVMDRMGSSHIVRTQRGD